MKQKVIQAIDQYKIIAILRGIPEDKLIPAVQALYDGGIRLAEITYCADGKISDEETARAIRCLTEHFKDRLFVGAGTVLTPEQVVRTAESGGQFIISPDTNQAVIHTTNARGLVSIPGALTPTEIVTAKNYGADYVKLFPITSLGCDYVKAITAPLNHIKLLAVGGIDTENMRAYAKSGVTGFGIGSNIVNKALIENGDYAALTALARKYTQVLSYD